MPPRLSATGHSEVGRRRSNQDAVSIRHLPGGRTLVAIADGMGGHAAGEVASRQALEVIAAELEAGAGLSAAIEAANAAVHEEADRSADRSGMGTTVVALLISGGEYEVANVGDSRAYRLDEGGIRQVTTDHSFVAEAVRSGELSEHEAARSPWRNALTRAVGTDARVEVDLLGPFRIDEPHAILLCSDGLYRAVTDEAIQNAFLNAPDPDSLVRSLVTLAYENGSDDNISAAVAAFGTIPGAAGAGLRAGGPHERAAGPADGMSVPGSDGPGGAGDPSPEARRVLTARRPRPGPLARLLSYELWFALLLLAAILGFVLLLALA